MESILLLCAVVIVICIVASRLSQRLGVPALLLFLALGMLFGSDGLFRIPFDNFEAAERICSVALIFIMFYGGFGTRWEAARPAAVFLLLAPFRCGVRQCLLVSWAGLRGAASIVFAIMAVASGAAIGYDLFHIVFCIALLSVAVQGSLLPLAARKLDMVDSAESISRTFNDYQDQRQLHLTRFPIGAGHPWVGRTIGECELPADALVVMLRRGSENVIPNGDTAIQAGDLMVLSTPLYEDDDGVSLREVPVAEHGDWIGRPIKELGIPAEVLIVLVRRADGTTVVPKGGTVLQQGDMLVVNEWEET